MKNIGGGVAFILVGFMFMIGGVSDFYRGIRRDTTPRHRYDSPGMFTGSVLVLLGIVLACLGLGEIF